MSGYSIQIKASAQRDIHKTVLKSIRHPFFCLHCIMSLMAMAVDRSTARNKQREYHNVHCVDKSKDKYIQKPLITL